MHWHYTAALKGSLTEPQSHELGWDPDGFNDWNYASGQRPATQTQITSDDPSYRVLGSAVEANYIPATSTGSAIDTSAPGSVAAVSAGGITINVIFDAAAMAAPASFRSGIQQAVGILAASITDRITVNIKIDYSGTGGGAAAGPDSGYYKNYSWINTNLINNATAGDATFNALPSGVSIQGQPNVVVWNAELKLWGGLAANDTSTDDASATFATDINPNLLVGVALHELTHAMGRVPYGAAPDIFDLYRFTSPGIRLFQGGATAPAAYFSLDGGNTKLADYGRNSDPSDFLNTGVQGPNDPFDEYYTGTTTQRLSTVDLKQLDALGFHLAGSDKVAPSLLRDQAITLAIGATAIISSSHLQYDDNTSPHAQEIYTILAGPTSGSLEMGGSPIRSFTQADVDNGLVSYHEHSSVASFDSFGFQVTDASGNTTSPASFQFSISAPSFAEPTFQLAGFGPSAGGWDSNDHYPRELADVNGDGMSDIVGFGDVGVYVSLATGAGTFGPSNFMLNAFAPNAGGWKTNDHYPRELADVNGDHKVDIVGFGEAGVYVALGNGDGSFGASTFELSAFGPSAGGWNSNNAFPRELADVNGDGMADIIGFGNAGVYVALATGNGNFAASVFKLAAFGPSAGGWTSNDQFPRELADVNGDGMADIVGFGNAGVYVALATGGGNFAPPTFNLAAFGPNAGGWTSNDQFPRELADINGDHKVDIVGFGNAAVYVALGNGDGSFQPSVAALLAFAPSAGGWTSDHLYPRVLADINHDGAADIVGFGQNGVYDALSNAFHLV